MISLGVVVVVVEVAIVVDKPSRLVVRWSGKLCWMAAGSGNESVQAGLKSQNECSVPSSGVVRVAEQDGQVCKWVVGCFNHYVFIFIIASN